MVGRRTQKDVTSDEGWWLRTIRQDGRNDVVRASIYHLLSWKRNEQGKFWAPAPQAAKVNYCFDQARVSPVDTRTTLPQSARLGGRSSALNLQ
jgi:hypothetical protein